eukprot:4316582-Amphidinium_carterae.1
MGTKRLCKAFGQEHDASDQFTREANIFQALSGRFWRCWGLMPSAPGELLSFLRAACFNSLGSIS